MKILITVIGMATMYGAGRLVTFASPPTQESKLIIQQYESVEKEFLAVYDSGMRTVDGHSVSICWYPTTEAPPTTTEWTCLQSCADRALLCSSDCCQNTWCGPGDTQCGECAGFCSFAAAACGADCGVIYQ